METQKVSWGCYLLQCADGSLYAGITNDMERRLIAHGKGTASKYTRSRLPVRAVYWEACEDRASASRREAEIKKMSRRVKEKLVADNLDQGNVGAALAAIYLQFAAKAAPTGLCDSRKTPNEQSGIKS